MAIIDLFQLATHKNTQLIQRAITQWREKIFLNIQ